MVPVHDLLSPKTWARPLCALTAASLCLAGCDSTTPSVTPDLYAEQPPSQADAPPTQAAKTQAPPPKAYALPMKDRGVFSQLDAKVRLREPAWLAQADKQHMSYMGRVFTVVDGTPVAWSELKPDDPRVIPAQEGKVSDADKDGIPDALDILIGAHKLTQNKASYKATYEQLKYPGGDVSAEIGVCTDVIVRAVRNSGTDLQQTLFDDIKRAPRAFPMVKKANTHIDHRRVKTLLPHFERHWLKLPADPKDTSRAWLPGDILFMDTYGDARPDHMGIVSDELGPSGYPLVINNWTDGFHTAPMDLLPVIKITHRFRAKGASLPVDAAHQGLEGILKRAQLKLPAAHKQLIIVTAYAWDSAWGELRRFERSAPDGPWQQVGSLSRVALGSAGLGVGLGALAHHVPAGSPHKREGDKRSPAGVFGLGAAFGPSAKAPYRGAWPWSAVDAQDRFVDDPESPHYNTWTREPTREQGPPQWRSAEALSIYSLGLIIEHNTHPTPKPNAGSAIFLHAPISANSPSPTLGCTSLARDELLKVLAWLKPEQQPILVQLRAQWL